VDHSLKPHLILATKLNTFVLILIPKDRLLGPLGRPRLAG
jgi:hypothetical protein